MTDDTSDTKKCKNMYYSFHTAKRIVDPWQPQILHELPQPRSYLITDQFEVPGPNTVFVNDTSDDEMPEDTTCSNPFATQDTSSIQLEILDSCQAVNEPLKTSSIGINYLSKEPCSTDHIQDDMIDGDKKREGIYCDLLAAKQIDDVWQPQTIDEIPQTIDEIPQISCLIGHQSQEPGPKYTIHTVMVNDTSDDEMPEDETFNHPFATQNPSPNQSKTDTN